MMNEEVTLRTYLIGQALSGLLAHDGGANSQGTAERAIVLADAVLTRLRAERPVEQWRVPPPTVAKEETK